MSVTRCKTVSLCQSQAVDCTFDALYADAITQTNSSQSRNNS